MKKYIWLILLAFNVNAVDLTANEKHMSQIKNNGRTVCHKLIKTTQDYDEVLIQISVNDFNDIHDQLDYQTIMLPNAPHWAKCVQLTVLSIVESNNFTLAIGHLVAGAQFGMVNDNDGLFYNSGDTGKALARSGWSNFSNENTVSLTIPIYKESNGDRSVKYQSLNRRNPSSSNDILNGLVIIATGYWK